MRGLDGPFRLCRRAYEMPVSMNFLSFKKRYRIIHIMCCRYRSWSLFSFGDRIVCCLRFSPSHEWMDEWLRQREHKSLGVRCAKSVIPTTNGWYDMQSIPIHCDATDTALHHVCPINFLVFPKRIKRETESYTIRNNSSDAVQKLQRLARACVRSAVCCECWFISRKDRFSLLVLLGPNLILAF